MSGKQPKTTDALMRYLRDKKGIAIGGSTQKRKLMNIGYYHGYKGYRYIHKSTNIIPYTNFDELLAVYEFDSTEKLRKVIPISVYNQIVRTDNNAKIAALRKFI